MYAWTFGDVLLQRDHRHLDGLYVGEVQEAWDWQSFGWGGWPLVECDVYGGNCSKRRPATSVVTL